MSLLRRKVVFVLLALYWPLIFVLTHLPIPKISRLQIRIDVSDKVAHGIIYFILVFLLWSVISPYKKVDWRRAAVWWILFVVVWYGVLDEWLQSYVGRVPDVWDFVADLSGSLISLVILSFISFWPAFILLTAGTIFFATNFVSINLSDKLFLIIWAFYFFAYSFFSLLWMRFLYIRRGQKLFSKAWLIQSLLGPVLVLVVSHGFYALTTKSLLLGEWFICLSAVMFSIGITYLIKAGKTKGITAN